MINDHFPDADPSELSQILILGMEEVLGTEPMNNLLQQCGLPLLNSKHLSNHTGVQIPYQKLSDIRCAIEGQFGTRSGRGLTLCSGRESFKYGLRSFGQETGLLDTKFRLQPTSAKMRTGLATMAALISRMAQASVQITEKNNRYLWQMEPCPLCWEEPSGGYTCPTFIGFLQEFLYWASGGKRFQVGNYSTEKPVIKPVCTLFIDKLALD